MARFKLVASALAAFITAACAAPQLPNSNSLSPALVQTGSAPQAPMQKAEAAVQPGINPDSKVDHSAPTAEQQAILDGLRNWGQAPELNNENWINSERLTLASQRGKVVLLEFWTFGCYNCRNVLPAMRDWYAKYADQGLEIIAVHTPEFDYEKEASHVQDACRQLGVTWPVAIDNDWATWRSYNNHYWPAMYLIDKAGNVRHLKIGEGQYKQTEAIIQALLAEGS